MLPLLRALLKTFFYFEASFAAVIASIFAVGSWRGDCQSRQSANSREPAFLLPGWEDLCNPRNSDLACFKSLSLGKSIGCSRLAS